ncbi:MAG TPA: hypothetical protein VN455_02220 [Methanotrichaceae archaeon]|nr:hypothetical protein [Methanotrichaceae archaeon]
MSLTVAAGRIRIAGTPIDVAEDTVELSDSSASLPRVDILIRDFSGDLVVIEGTPAIIEDDKGLGNWHQYFSPLPNESIPAGAILGAIYVGPGVISVGSNDIWMFAGCVEDLATTILTPGTDSRSASEKAIRTIVDAKPSGTLVTSVGDPGSNSNIPAERAVRLALNDKLDASEKAVASGVASLDSSSKVVQNPANATATPTADKIPIAGVGGKLAAGWLPDQAPDSLTLGAVDAAKVLTRGFSVAWPDDGTTLIPANSEILFECPIKCTITAIRLASPQTGSIAIAVWKDTFANLLPTADDLVGTYSITSSNKGETTGLSIAVVAGDWFLLHVNSVTSLRGCTISFTATVVQ